MNGAFLLKMKRQIFIELFYKFCCLDYCNDFVLECYGEYNQEPVIHHE